MVKKMVFPRPKANTIPQEAYLEAKQNFLFVEPGDRKYCTIKPYVIITDGSDIMIKKEEGSIHLGWHFDIDRIKKLPFEQVIENNVLEKFWALWEKIEILNTPATKIKYDNNLVYKIGAEYKGLNSNRVSVHSTNRGTFDVNKNEFYPVYFIIIPNSSAINFIPEEEMEIGPMSLAWLAQPINKISFSYVSRCIMEMIRSGEILLPLISEPKREEE